jgi:aerobic-type carbon monoxide dehydrogenase small subunit (CoxS/CutS family)
MRLKINGQEIELQDDTNALLLWALRDELGLIGTRFGCGLGQCGACTVLLDGQAVRSCQTPLASVGEGEVTTIEGLAGDSALHPLQQAFIDEQVPQCGYCMSGQIMNAAGLLNSTPQPTDAQIIEAMQGNICRCGTYVRIKRAIRRAAEQA